MYFIYKTTQEMDGFLGDSEYSPGTELVLSVVTCGLWNVYWDYRVGKRIARMCGRVGLPETDNATLYLALDLLRVGGFLSAGLLNPALQQDGLNRVWRAAARPPPSST